MTDVTAAMQAKSDQLNAADIMGAEPVITIRDVQVREGEQPVSIYYHGDNNRPWKPSKGMIRILAAAWGTDSSQWVGKSAQLYNDPEVVYAGQKVGGVRIKALSDIDQRGLNCTITISRQKRQPYPVAWLDTTRPTYPAEKFDRVLPAMGQAMADGKMTLEQVVSRCQQTGDLTSDQLRRLEELAPVHLDDEQEPEKTGGYQLAAEGEF